MLSVRRPQVVDPQATLLLLSPPVLLPDEDSDLVSDLVSLFVSDLLSDFVSELVELLEDDDDVFARLSFL